VIFFVYFHYSLNFPGSAVLPPDVISILLIHKLLFVKRKKERNKERKKEINTAYI
jgi:hypothetical protein